MRWYGRKHGRARSRRCRYVAQTTKTAIQTCPPTFSMRYGRRHGHAQRRRRRYAARQTRTAMHTCLPTYSMRYIARKQGPLPMSRHFPIPSALTQHTSKGTLHNIEDKQSPSSLMWYIQRSIQPISRHFPVPLHPHPPSTHRQTHALKLQAPTSQSISAQLHPLVPNPNAKQHWNPKPLPPHHATGLPDARKSGSTRVVSQRGLETNESRAKG